MGELFDMHFLVQKTVGEQEYYILDEMKKKLGSELKERKLFNEGIFSDSNVMYYCIALDDTSFMENVVNYDFIDPTISINDRKFQKNNDDKIVDLHKFCDGFFTNNLLKAVVCMYEVGPYTLYDVCKVTKMSDINYGVLAKFPIVFCPKNNVFGISSKNSNYEENYSYCIIHHNAQQIYSYDS